MSESLREIAKKHSAKLSKIKVLLFDVDGILSNGLIHWDGEEVGWNRTSHTRDGYMMKVLIDHGYPVGVVTGGDSMQISKRFVENLKLPYVFMGTEDKREAFNKVLADGYKDEEILYMGDEFFDVPLLRKSGFSATVPGVSAEVAESVDYITRAEGGMGAAREVMDLFRYVHDITPVVPEFE